MGPPATALARHAQIFIPSQPWITHAGGSTRAGASIDWSDAPGDVIRKGPPYDGPLGPPSTSGGGFVFLLVDQHTVYMDVPPFSLRSFTRKSIASRPVTRFFPEASSSSEKIWMAACASMRGATSFMR